MVLTPRSVLDRWIHRSFGDSTTPLLGSLNKSPHENSATHSESDRVVGVVPAQSLVPFRLPREVGIRSFSTGHLRVLPYTRGFCVCLCGVLYVLYVSVCLSLSKSPSPTGPRERSTLCPLLSLMVLVSFVGSTVFFL